MSYLHSWKSNIGFYHSLIWVMNASDFFKLFFWKSREIFFIHWFSVQVAASVLVLGQAEAQSLELHSDLHMGDSGPNPGL